MPAAGGSRPDRLPDVSGPQERVQRHTVQQIVDVFLLPYLDDLMPQMVVQSVEVLHFFLQRWPGAAEQTWNCEARQVIDVPKIAQDCTPQRLIDTLRQPQTVEQLVEVPTIISFSSLQRTVEQNVGISVVGGSGAGGGLSGFLPGQSYSFTAEQIVDNPVPRPRGAGDLQGLSRGQSSTAFSEQIAEFPDPGGGREDFQPVQGSAVSSSDSPGQAGQGVFSTLPRKKKSAKIPRTQGSELGAHSSSWAP